MRLYEEKIGGKTLYDGKILTLRVDRARLEDGREVTREVVGHRGAVCVVAVNEQDELLLVRQFRYPHGKVLTEIPAGKLDPGETPESCGRRELEEETGCRADTFVSLGKLLPTPAYSEEVIYMYYAAGLHRTQQHLDEGEFLDVEKLPFAGAVEKVLDGTFTDAKTQIGIMKAHLLRQAGRL